MATETQKKLAALLSLAAKKRFLKKAVFSKCADKEVIRAAATLFERGGEVYIQLETFKTDGKALHKNILPSDTDALCAMAEPFAQINLIGDGADAEYRRSKSGSETVLGEKKFTAAAENYGKKIEIKAHNRAKAYAFDGSEPFLYELGVADKNGRVFDKKQAKFRQMLHFFSGTGASAQRKMSKTYAIWVTI